MKLKVNEAVRTLRSSGTTISRRDFLRVLSLTSAAGLLAACGAAAPAAVPTTAPAAPADAPTGAPAASTPKAGGTWRMALQGNPTAYPITAPGALVDILINKTIYNNLVEYRLNGDEIEIVPDLAESWTTNDDLTEYTFVLKQGVTWHDGTPLTAEDVKFTFDAILNPEVNAAQRAPVAVIASTEVVDERTVKFTLKSPSAAFPVMLGYNQAIVPKHLLDGQDLNEPVEFIRNPVGTGPFKFKEFVQGSYFAIEANADFFGGAPLLDGIVFRVIPDGNARVAQLLAGEVDFAVIEPAQIEAVQADPSITIRKVPQVNYFFFAINHEQPFLQDVRVRQALSHAIDKQAIVDQFLGGNGTVATGPINPLLGKYYTPNVTTYPYDMTRAATLLTEAGWTKGADGILANSGGEKLALRFNGPNNNPVMVQIITYAQQQYKQLGIDVTLDIQDWPVHLATYRDGGYDLLMQWWITPPEPDQYPHYHSEVNNRWRYANPEVDQLLVEGLSTADEAQRIATYKRLQEVLATDVPVIYLYYPQEVQALRNTMDMPEMGYRDALTWMEKVWMNV